MNSALTLFLCGALLVFFVLLSPRDPFAFSQEEQTYLEMEFDFTGDLEIPEEQKILKAIDTTRYTLDKYDDSIDRQLAKQRAKWMDNLNSNKPKEREQAIVALINLKDENAVGPLIGIMLEDKDRTFQHLAAWGIARYGPEIVMEKMLQLAEAVTDPQERINVIWVLGELKKPSYKVEKIIATYLKDSDPVVREVTRRVALRLKIELISEVRQKIRYYKIKPVKIKMK